MFFACFLSSKDWARKIKTGCENFQWFCRRQGQPCTVKSDWLQLSGTQGSEWTIPLQMQRGPQHVGTTCCSRSPLWFGKSQSPGNTDKAHVGSEHLLRPTWWTKGLVRIAALLKTQPGWPLRKNETLRCPKFGTTLWTEEVGMGAKEETGFQLRHVWALPSLNSNQLVSLQHQKLREARQCFSLLDISVSQQWVKDGCLGISNSGHVTKTQVLPRTPSYLFLTMKHANLRILPIT